MRIAIIVILAFLGTLFAAPAHAAPSMVEASKPVWSATRYCKFIDPNTLTVWGQVAVRWQLTNENGQRRVTAFRWWAPKASEAQRIVSARIYEQSLGGITKGQGIKWDDKGGEDDHIFWSTTTGQMPWIDNKKAARIYIHLRRGGATGTGPTDCYYEHDI